ncbi:MAG: hypothetical protein L0Y79_02715 [Chlorobi bacterium]|nr:hypothetical protein [Chlorobiota bacterium]MCI0716215.1 hypothetical protein [Chlorobiota bacterium]
MNIKSIILLLLLFICSLTAQTFKEVKTAQDVIDNYIESNGGADNLREIKSILMEGTMNFMGSDVPIKFYSGNDIFYMNFSNSQFPMMVAADTKKKTGWSKFGEVVKDASSADIERHKNNIISTLWGYYIDKDKYDITYQLLQNEKVGDKDAYVVEFLNKDSIIQTVYFDTENFKRVKVVKGTMSSEYSDFRNVSASGIYMAYKVSTPQGDLTVTKYEFNTKFDKKLLKKPKE